MSGVPHDANQPEPGPEENAQGSPSVQGVAGSPLTHSGDAPQGADAAATAAALKREAARVQAAQRIASLADKTAGLTKQATASAVAAGKGGLAKAAKIGRDTVIPTVRERTRPDRLKKDYRDFLLWLHANVLDSAIERLFFIPTKGYVALSGLTVRGNNRASGHDYKPTPNSVFKWALAAVAEEDIGRMSFVDYGAGKGRVMLLASQYPFTQVGGIEFAEELHDNAMMNIAQFPRSRMKCRNVECVLDDVVNITPLDGEVVHYFFNPFGRRDLRRGDQGDRRLLSRAAPPPLCDPDRHGRCRSHAQDRRVSGGEAASGRAHAGAGAEPLLYRRLPLARVRRGLMMSAALSVRSVVPSTASNLDRAKIRRTP
jgi:predicted RNA methylase